MPNTARRPVPPPKPKAAPTAALTEFKVGDKIDHKAFGAGEIVKLTPMGGDALVEIRFESGETKKLMLRVASQHMKKSEF